MDVIVASRDGEGHLRQRAQQQQRKVVGNMFIRDIERNPDWPKQWEMRLVCRRLRPDLAEPSARVRDPASF